MNKNDKQNLKSEVFHQSDEIARQGIPIRPNRRSSLIVYLIIFIQGVTMGAVQIIPGVSAGTAAFVMGIYYRWLNSIGTFIRPYFWKMVLQRQWREAAKTADAGFLAPLFIGIAVGVLTLARGIEWLLENYQIYSWSIFLGMIAASCYVVAKRISVWNPMLVLVAAAGATGGYFLSGLSGGNTPDSAWFIVLSGAAAAGALVLPGVSGSYILIVLGKYQQALNALNNADISFLALLALGAVITVIVFAKLLGGLLRRYHSPTASLLLGFMIGSIRALWPWQPTIGNYALPPNILEGLAAAGLVVIGLVMVLGFELWIKRRGSSTQKHA